MQDASGQSVLFVLGMVAAAAGFIGVVFLANLVLSPRAGSPAKESPYECGMEQAGAPWTPFNLRFALIALLFVLFDAESVLLFAVASALRGSLAGVIEVGAFVAFLALGLAYAWKTGALKWPS
ncbi:MAG: NADH-quinone oxidoreductase subunit A [Actinobacteria bacterium]|nr:MAG: NADH-quinone oxidoreductase subunit A [Actinomycetota bacterium]